MKPSSNLFFDVKRIEIQNIKFHKVSRKTNQKKRFLLKPPFFKTTGQKLVVLSETEWEKVMKPAKSFTKSETCWNFTQKKGNSRQKF